MYYRLLDQVFTSFLLLLCHVMHFLSLNYGFSTLKVRVGRNLTIKRNALRFKSTPVQWRRLVSFRFFYSRDEAIQSSPRLRQFKFKLLELQCHDIDFTLQFRLVMLLELEIWPSIE